METYKLNWTLLEQKVFSLLCKRAGEKLSQREIALTLEVSPTAVANSLVLLKEVNLVIVEKTKTINFVSLNRDEVKAIELKRIENLKAIYQSGLKYYLAQELPGGTIILFGSYSLGEDAQNSDIDIAVIGRKAKELKLDGFEKYFGRKININFYNSWKEINDNLKNNILNGIVIEGSIVL